MQRIAPGRTPAAFAALLFAAVLLAGCEQQDTLMGAGNSGDKPAPEINLSFEPPEGEPTIGKASDSQVIDGRYIVVFENHVTDPKGRAAQITQQRAGRLLHVYQRVLSGFAAELPAAAAAAIERLPFVKFVEPDREVFAVGSQTDATWGLDRADQRDLPLNSIYNYDADGSGVTVYVIDTGIRTSHDEFGVRASVGFDAIGDGRNGQDCNGHGTHVAGTIGGSTYGMAKEARLVAVRVLNCRGSGMVSGVIAGIDWVTQNAEKPAVANMSLGGGASTALDDAVTNSIAAGVTYAVAAGNDDRSACNYSPARVEEAVTTGATTPSDARSSFSNYGSCVDVFAPGSGITSAWHSSNTATNTISGTSMASPHVAGTAALYLQYNAGAAPAEVMDAIVTTATQGRITDTGSGSPNLLLYSLLQGDGGGGTPPPPPPESPCAACESYTGTLSGRGDGDYHPNGGYYYSPAGTHQGYLRGPSSGADFDLYLYKWSFWFGWYRVSWGVTADAAEDVSYDGGSGYYTWHVYSYSGSGDYTFYLDRP